MKKPLSGFWGKFDKEDETWHPLSAHCADVAACGEALLQKTLLRKRLARLAGMPDLSLKQVARICVFIALHDVGKTNEGFYSKIRISPSFGKFPKSGHEGEALYLLSGLCGAKKRELIKALPVDHFENWVEGGVWMPLLAASINHHGKIRSCTERPPNFRDSVWSERSFLEISSLVEKTKIWFPLAFEEGGGLLPNIPAFQHALTGIIIAADWIGSDTQWFPYQEDPGEDRMSFARRQAAIALEQVGLDISAVRRRVPRSGLFETMCSFPTPRGAQAAILELGQSLPSEDSLVLVEAETGAGKTEAALLHFFQLLGRGMVEGMFFALPTRTAATQIYHRVLEATRKVLGSEAPPVVLGLPGVCEVDGQHGKSLPNFEVLWPDTELQSRGWAAQSPKRFLTGAIVVGTVDQVLLSTLTTEHAHFRASMLSRQLLVVDEVHASDAYMGRLLQEVLRFHRQTGGHALLMSATLGSSLSSRLFGTPPLSLEEAVKVPYPSLSWKTPAGAVELVEIGASFQKKIRIETRNQSGDPDAIARMALDAAHKGARVLIIRNTVRDCVSTQRALEALGQRSLLFRARGITAPHHSRFAKVDRKLLDQSVEAAFGGSRGERGIVLCATQTVQQSLDLDADFLITDLCPIDVLLQRMGRLFRHPNRPRPPSFPSPTTVVLLPEEEDFGKFILKDGGAPWGPHGFGRVYPDLRVLEATRRLCARGVFEIPSDNRMLVEKATHPTALSSLVSELGPLWKTHSNYIRGNASLDQRLASGLLVNREAEFLSEDSVFPSKLEAPQVATRLGVGDRMIEFTDPLEGPFGTIITSLVVPFHMLGGEEVPKKISGEKDGEKIRVKIGERTLEYSNHGLHVVPKSKAE
jgi:CRISPR-associated endonuclease/helicase Cas3